ncbi:MrcB family domain-containing protein [Candidatus Omnitrophota bacterium]
MKQALLKVLNEYKANTRGALAGNSLANYIRRDLPAVIKATAHIPKQYLIEGAPGQGNWAEIPWVGIFDKSITTSAQKGYYIVYLFDANMEGVYLTLGIGWTQFEDKYHPLKKAREEIKSTAVHYRGIIKSALGDFPAYKINLHAKHTLGKGYELGTICGKYYSKDSIPDTDTLAHDLSNLIGVYRELKGELSGSSITEKQPATKILLTREEFQQEEAGEEYKAAGKDPKQVKQLASQAETKPPRKATSIYYPRNPYVSANAKNRAKGKCELCDQPAPFLSRHGKPFLECHHIKERAEGGTDTINNAVALCPNCHRKMHHLGLVEDKNKLKQKASE